METPGAPPRRRRRLLRRALGVVALALAAWLVVLDRQVVRGFGEARWRYPLRVYAAPATLAVGSPVARGAVAALEALGYRRVRERADEPGTYARTAAAIDVHLRPAAQAEGEAERPARRVRLEVEGDRVRRIVAADGQALPGVELEPPLLAGLFAGEWTAREPLSIDALPTHVVDAVLAAEDVRFLSHPGLDFPSLARAVQVNWEAQAVRQGGSTITQQVIKTQFLTQERTIGRKLREIPMALALELHFEKREILECYLATVYLGHDGLLGVYGFAEGARAYFGKRPAELTIGEAATLAGMIRAPNPLSPLRHPERARARRDQVIATLEQLGWITPAQGRAARAERLPVAPGPPRRPAPPEAYFLQHVRRELEARGLAPASLERGSALFTTLDVALQADLSAAVERAARRLDQGPRGERGAQLAAVAIDARDGSIRALVGGRDFLRSQLDRVTQMRRGVGSLFKPFVMLAAISDPATGITPATLVRDEPIEIRQAGVVWSPKNFDDRFRGDVTVRTAVEQSLNVPTVRVAERVGIERIAALGDRLELAPTPLPRGPAIALGAFDASLLAVAAAYTVFPAEGVRVAPRVLDGVRAPSGRVLFRDALAPARVAEPAPTYVVHSMLAGVVDRGTARAVRVAGLRRALAGKTGTTNEDRDAWFVGYTPSLVIGVWVGFDDGRPMRAGAAQLAVPLWRDIAQRALADAPAERFAVPDGVELVAIERATGHRAAPGCGPAITEAFVAGTAPEAWCANATAADRGEAPVRTAGAAERAASAWLDLRAAGSRALGWLGERLRGGAGRGAER